MRFVSQKYNTNCFPVALKNCAIYLTRKLDQSRFIKFCACNTGRSLNIETAIMLSGLPLEETKNLEDIFKNGGIITIMHPIINLHSVFCYPYKDRIMCINSWLGCNELPLFKEELIKWIAKKPNDRMYFIDM